MKLIVIDSKGRLFGRWNIIDCLVLIVGLVTIINILPFCWFAFKKHNISKPHSHYIISAHCPICGKRFDLKIIKGQLPPDKRDPPEEKRVFCESCGNHIILFKKPNLQKLPYVPDFLQELAKQLLREKGITFDEANREDSNGFMP